MKSGGGRKKSAIWQHFTTVDNQIICKYCQSPVSSRALRLQNHINTCSAYHGSDDDGTPPAPDPTEGTNHRNRNKKSKNGNGNLLMENRLKLLEKSIKQLKQTIENVRNWVSSSFGVDIPEECFVFENCKTRDIIETEDIVNVKNELQESYVNEAAADDDNYFNFDPNSNNNELIDECLNKRSDKNMSTLQFGNNDEILEDGNDSNSNHDHKRKRASKSKEMDNDFSHSEGPEFELPETETEEDDDDSDLDYGKRRRISQRKKKPPKNYNFTNSKYSSSAKCRICKKVFSSVSYLNFIHMPTHKDEQVQKKPKTGTGGRTKSDIWKYYTETEEEEDGKIFKVVRCNFCSTNVSSKADRLKKHFDSCSGRDVTSSLAHVRKTQYRTKSLFRTGGRYKSTIWQYFNTTTKQIDGKFFKVTNCANCGKHVSAKVDRLQRHFDKCSPKDSSIASSGAASVFARPTSVKRKDKKTRNGRGGRTKNDIWQFFTTSNGQNEDGENVKHWEKISVCVFCKCKVSPKAFRLQAHIEKCPAYHEDEAPSTEADASISIHDKQVADLTSKSKDCQNPTFRCTEEDCKSAFFSEIRLKIHLKRIHNIPQEAPEVKHRVGKFTKLLPKPLVNADGSLLFNCPQETCTSSFHAIVYLKKHLKRIHNIPPVSRTYERTVNINPGSNDHTRSKTYMCPVCGKILKIGSKRVHDATHENLKQYRCDQCPSAFNLYQHLRKHRNLHTREDVRICQHCGKEFIRLESLKLHQNTVHNDVRSFTCEYPNCDKSYKIKRQLVLHQRAVHIVEKPYKCNLCSKKSFHTELGLKDHLLRSHKNEQE